MSPSTSTNNTVGDNKPHISTATEAAFLATNTWVASRFPASSAVPFTPGSRQSSPVLPTTQLHDRLFSRTLHTSDAVPVCLGYHTPADVERVTNAQPADGPADIPLIESATMIFDLGKGVTGYQGITHGGMFGLLVDECVGNYLVLNKAAAEQLLSGLPQGGQGGEKKPMPRLAGLGENTAFTIGMNVRFLRPIPTPAVVLVRSWLDRIEGSRKLVVGSSIEDRDGIKYGTCESTWYSVPLPKGSKL